MEEEKDRRSDPNNLHQRDFRDIEPALEPKGMDEVDRVRESQLDLQTDAARTDSAWEGEAVEPPSKDNTVTVKSREPSGLSGHLVLLLLVACFIIWDGWDRPFNPKGHANLPASGRYTSANRIVVDFVDDITEKQIGAINATNHIQLEYNSIHARHSKLMVATVPAERQVQVLVTLAKHALVESAEPEYRYERFMVPNDAEYSKQWHLTSIDMEKAWDITRGKGVTVAVIDTGVAIEEEPGAIQVTDLANTNHVRGYDFPGNDDLADDVQGHGTHVAGTIAQSTNNGRGGAGIAFEATIMPIKVLDDSGQGTNADIADGIRFAADNNADIVNMSLGGPNRSQIIEAAVDYAKSKGVTLICAAGNSGKNEVLYPAGYPQCIAVSSVGPSGKMAYYSTWGDHVDIAAPGGDLRNGQQGGVFQSTVQNGRDVFKALQGTSMACPHVTGVAALIHSLGTTDPDEIRNVLRRTATPRTPKDKYGSGILNAYEAVSSISTAGNFKRTNVVLVLGLGGACLFFGFRKDLGRHLINRYRVELLAVVIGMALPEVIKLVFGFDSYVNLLGHSVLVPTIAIMKSHDVRRRTMMSWVTVGLVCNLTGNWILGVVPFPVLDAWRISLWYLVNLAVGGVIIYKLLYVSVQGKKAPHEMTQEDGSHLGMKKAGLAERYHAKQVLTCPFPVSRSSTG